MNEMQVLNARSGVCPGLPSGLSGSQPWQQSSTMPHTNQKRLTISRALRNCFQFISCSGLIPQSLYTHFSTGAMKSSHVRSPLYTLAM